jgi:hypothetical protein
MIVRPKLVDGKVLSACLSIQKGDPGERGLQGEQGIPGSIGPQGIQGPAGTVGTIIGSYSTLAALQAAIPTGKPGEFYYVAPDLYVWDSVNSVWKNVGAIAGPQGVQGLQGIPGAAGKDAFVPRFWQFTMNAASAGSATADGVLPFDTLSYSTGEDDVKLNTANKLITIKPGRYMCIVSFMTSGATGSAPTVTALRRKVGDSAFTRIPMLNISGNAGPVTLSFVVNYTDTYEVGIGCNNGTITWNTNTPQARLMITRVA